MTTVVVSGALANKPGNGGNAWTRLSWTLGLRRLGYRVCFVEQLEPAACVDVAGAPTTFERSANRAYFAQVCAEYPADGAALIYDGGRAVIGMTHDGLVDLGENTAVLINIGGHLTYEPLLSRVHRRVFFDDDPGFTQFWRAGGSLGAVIERHDRFYTVGTNVGRPECPIPTGGVTWRPVLPPVVLAEWPVVPAASTDRFTTVASWRGAYGPIEVVDTTYGLKVHELRKLLPLPTRVRASLEIALDIDPADERDRAALLEHGWRLVDPRAVAATPADFRRYVQESSAELSAAQGMYVQTRSGWFSDRTTRYLASGKPVVVQDTGIGRVLPTGEGLLTFKTCDEAAEAVERVQADYARHARAARMLAAEHFDSDRVLGRMMRELEITP